MRGRIAPWLAWSLAYVSLILCVAAILLFIPTLSVQTPSSWGTGGVSAVIVFLPLYFPEGRLPSRRWRPIAWFAVLRTLLAGSSASRASLWEPPSQPSFYADYSLIVRPSSLPGGDIAIWSLSWTAPVLSAAPTFDLLLFPDGRLLSHRWRPVAWLAVGAAAMSLVGLAARELVRELGLVRVSSRWRTFGRPGTAEWERSER